MVLSLLFVNLMSFEPHIHLTNSPHFVRQSFGMGTIDSIGRNRGKSDNSVVMTFIEGDNMSHHDITLKEVLHLLQVDMINGEI